MADELMLLHGGALGDLALALQMLLPSVRAGPGLRVVSRVDPGVAGECQPPISWRSLETIGAHALFSAGLPFPVDLRSELAGRSVINAFGRPGEQVHGCLRTAGARRVFSFDPRHTPGHSGHIIEQWRADLASQGVAFESAFNLNAPWSISPSEALRARGHALLGLEPDAQREILIHPGSGGAAKCWPLQQFARTAELLSRDGRAVRFLLGPVELDRWPKDTLGRLAGIAPVICPTTTRDLAAVLCSASLVICNDSGVAHLAALLGTALLAIFGPTPAAVWRPVGPRTRVLQGNPHRESWGLIPEKIVAEAAFYSPDF